MLPGKLPGTRPFPSACQYVGMTLRQMSFYPLARRASPCVPQGRGYCCVTPQTVSTPGMYPWSSHQVPRPVPMGCTVSSGGTMQWEQWGGVPPSLWPP